ncbi:MAG: PilZ domain-containing protein [Planctomycetota bacterium]|jgi:hypothetical protein|nr:PilZ domain-containing protein [Planctomycetota bacterium]
MTDGAADWSLPAGGELDGVVIRERLEPGWRSLWFGAEQSRLSRRLALKILREEFAGNSAVRNAFFEAGRQNAAILHPAAIPVINLYPGRNCLAFQPAPGRPLREFRGKLASAALAGVGEAIMDCLSSLHATGRGHGCLTPGNIFLDGGLNVQLGDFFQPPAFVHQGSLRAGWPEFAPPGLPESGDWRSDVFSLGKCLIFAAAPGEAESGTVLFARALAAGEPRPETGSPRDILDRFGRLRRREEKETEGGPEAASRRPRRRYRRIPAVFEVSLRRRSANPIETAAILSRVRDIGESGVFVETDDESIGTGSVLEMNFRVKGAEGDVHAFGIVRWVSSPPLIRGVGVQFVEIDLEGLSLLRRFLARGSGRQ